MKYKVGDKVRIKSLDWYNENKDEYGYIACGSKAFFIKMSNWCGKIATIKEICKTNYYRLEEYDFDWTDEMIEGLAEESDDFEKMYMESEKRYEEEYSTSEYCHEQSFKWGFQEGYDYAHENEKLEINLKNGYQFVDENGKVINATKIVLEKKKKEYPNNIYHCVRTLGLHSHPDDASKYKTELIHKLQTLLICRDAYWKIAGEEMGLGKPWEPDWNIRGYYAIARSYGDVVKTSNYNCDLTFVFPTEEMRDAFYENFKEEIEQCKELL